MAHVTVTLPDGSQREVQRGTLVSDVAGAISPRLAKAALAAIVDDQLVDLSASLDHDVSLRLVTPKSPEALKLYRHTYSRLLLPTCSLVPSVALDLLLRMAFSTTSSWNARSYRRTSRRSKRRCVNSLKAI